MAECSRIHASSLNTLLNVFIYNESVVGIEHASTSDVDCLFSREAVSVYTDKYLLQQQGVAQFNCAWMLSFFNG